MGMNTLDVLFPNDLAQTFDRLYQLGRGHGRPHDQACGHTGCFLR